MFVFECNGNAITHPPLDHLNPYTKTVVLCNILHNKISFYKKLSLSLGGVTMKARLKYGSATKYSVHCAVN